ncbi:FAD:protein FMN transferase [bacterium]|nr:FAD:protein FMN transferase [bacterium]
MEFENKRSSPRMTFAVVLIIVLVAFAVYFSGGYHGFSKPTYQTRTRVMFDTLIRIELEGDKGLDYPQIFHAIWEELELWEKEVDAYDMNSYLFAANASDCDIIVPSRLSKSIHEGFDAIIATGGHFDIRLGELTALWDFSGEGKIPNDKEISAAIERVHYPIKLRGDTLIKTDFFPKLDLGGLAKGYALDMIYSFLDTIEGIDRMILDLGGNIRVKSKKNDNFTIGIQSPVGGNIISAKFRLKSGWACATTGDYQRYFVKNGVHYHHILDPKDGKPARGCSGVTIIADKGLTADIYSTALFVMGPEYGMEFLKSNPQLEAIFLDSTGTVIAGNLKVEE